jgi:hypothetical protein
MGCVLCFLGYAMSDLRIKMAACIIIDTHFSIPDASGLVEKKNEFKSLNSGPY